MNTQHTPGPWEIDREFIRNTEGQMIAEVQRYHYFEIQLPDGTLDVDSDEMPWKANAELIAAAPEMYELLEQMEEDLMVAWACVPEEFARKFKQYGDNLKVLKAKIESDEQ